MSYLQFLIDNHKRFDEMIMNTNHDPNSYNTDREKFIFLCKESVKMQNEGRINNIPEIEIPLIKSKFFTEAVNKVDTPYEVALYIIKKMSKERNVKFGEDNIREFTAMTPEGKVRKIINGRSRFFDDEYASPVEQLNIPFERQNGSLGRFLCLDRFINFGEIIYLTETNHKILNTNYLLFYVYHNGRVEELENVDRIYTDHSDSFLFAYPEPYFYSNTYGDELEQMKQNFYMSLEKLISDKMSFYNQPLNLPLNYEKKDNAESEIFKAYMKAFPMERPRDFDDFDSEDEYLDLLNFINNRVIKYVTEDEKIEMDDEELMTYFYILPDGSLIEKDHTDNTENYSKALLFVYPSPEYKKQLINYDLEDEERLREEYYESIKSKINDYLKQSEAPL